jgi:hypothetical protein
MSHVRAFRRSARQTNVDIAREVGSSRLRPFPDPYLPMHEPLMNEHKFKLRQVVEYYPPRGLHAPRGAYHVTAELPVRLDEFEYRIKHPREQRERVARERNLGEPWL